MNEYKPAGESHRELKKQSRRKSQDSGGGGSRRSERSSESGGERRRHAVLVVAVSSTVEIKSVALFVVLKPVLLLLLDAPAYLPDERLPLWTCD